MPKADPTKPAAAPRIRTWTPTPDREVSLLEPLHWHTSVAETDVDLFAAADTGFIERVYRTMVTAGRNSDSIFLLSTQHPEEAVRQLGFVGMRIFADHGWKNHTLRNVLHGTLLRTQADADRLLPLLLQVPGRHWVDVVPEEEIDLRKWMPLYGAHWRCKACGSYTNTYCNCQWCDASEEQMVDGPARQGNGRRQAIDWLRVRGEDKPLNPQWLRSLRDQTKAAGVGFHFAGWGAWRQPDDDTPRGVPEVYIDHRGRISRTQDGRYEPGCPCDTHPTTYSMVRVGRSRSGRTLDGRTLDDLPGLGY